MPGSKPGALPLGDWTICTRDKMYLPEPLQVVLNLNYSCYLFYDKIYLSCHFRINNDSKQSTLISLLSVHIISDG